jgi:hypothetical protein
MADTKISALTAVTTAADTDEYATNQAGTSKKTTRLLLLSDIVKQDYTSQTADPSAPASNHMGWYAFQFMSGGLVRPKWIGPAGVDQTVQAALYVNGIQRFKPASATTGTGINSEGVAWTSNGTVTHPTPATTAPAISNQMRRTRYANVVTTTNQQLGPRMNTVAEMAYWRGNAAGLGGFYFFTRFIVELYPASTVRIFAGLTGAGATSSVCISDTVVNDTCGLWHDTTDPSSGANSFNLVTRNTATTTKTSIALSNAIAAGNSYDFHMYCPPNGSTIYYRLVDLVNNVVYTGNSTTTLPTATTFMTPQVQMSNGTANITVTTSAIGVASIYVESDK